MLKRFSFSRIALLAALFFPLASCTLEQVKPASGVDSSLFDPQPFSLDQASNPGCLTMMNHYCNSLYQPGHDGNLMLSTKTGVPIFIRQGKTQNDLKQVYYELAQSKIKNQKSLPSDFASILRAHNYFQKTEDFIHQKPREFMNLIDRMESMEQLSELDHLWKMAIEEALLMRTAHQFPSYPQITDDLTPPEMTHYQSQERRILLSEVARAIWRNNPNWNRVNSTFEELRAVYLEVLKQLPITVSLRNDWSQRLRTMKLVPPGSMPELTDQDCASTTVNAYYYSHYNVLTVCAGDFNSEDSLQTLGHEMSHALDIDRSLFQYFKSSEISEELQGFEKNWCSKDPGPISCGDWESFKSKLGKRAADLAQFAPDVPKFNRCLKRSPTRVLDAANVQRFASTASQARIRDLADEEAFLRITRPKLPLSNGKNVHNPAYLNPCSYLKSDWSHESLDGELSVLTVFLNEYQCNADKDPLQKLRTSINNTQAIFGVIDNAMIASEGEFSSRRELVDEGYSSSPVERFADVMGSYVVAEYMKNFQSLWDRRATFLASSSWQCSAPSLSQNFPAESLVLRQYVQDSHTDGEDRKKEILSSPIREVLGCKQDFEWNECRL